MSVCWRGRWRWLRCSCQRSPATPNCTDTTTSYDCALKTSLRGTLWIMADVCGNWIVLSCYKLLFGGLQSLHLNICPAEGVKTPCGRTRAWLAPTRRSTRGSWRGITTDWRRRCSPSSTGRSHSFINLSCRSTPTGESQPGLSVCVVGWGGNVCLPWMII